MRPPGGRTQRDSAPTPEKRHSRGEGRRTRKGLTFGPDRSGDGTADLYVTDQLNRQIRVYAGPLKTGAQQPGAFLETFIGYAAGQPGSLTDPVGVAFIDTKFYVSDCAERTIKVYDAATGAFESDLVADVGANPTYFIAIVPEPSHGIFAAVALACLAWRPRSARICSFGFCCIRAVN